MKIDFGEFLAGAILGFGLAGWLFSHALTEQEKSQSEACDKQGTMIINHQVYICGKKP